MEPSKIVERLSKLLDNNPGIKSVLDNLYKNNIRYGLYAGSYVALVADNRVSADIDLLLADDDLDKVLSILPDAVYKEKDHGEFVYLTDLEKVEFMSYGGVITDGKRYMFRLTDLSYQNSSDYIVEDVHIRLLNPVDTILLKAMLQRGQAEGKHDIDDIKALLKCTQINKDYLFQRIVECGAHEPRVIDLLKDLEII